MGKNVVIDPLELLGLISIKEVLGGFSHEIRQPLNVFSLACDVIRFKLQRSSIREEDAGFILKQLNRISEQVRRAEDLVGNFRRFSRPGPEASLEADLRDALLTVVRLMKQQFVTREIELRVEEPGQGLISSVGEVAAQRIIVQAFVFIREEAFPGRVDHNRSSEETGRRSVNVSLVDEGPHLTLMFDWGAEMVPAVYPRLLADLPGLALASELLLTYGGRIDLDADAMKVSFPRRATGSA